MMERTDTSALVLCSDGETSSTLEHALEQLKIERQLCLTSWAAEKEMRARDFDLLLVDFDEPDAPAILEAWTSRGPNSSKIVVAFGAGNESLKAAQRGCAHFLLQKPLVPSLLIKTLNVANTLVIKKRRASYRCSVNIKAQATFAREQGLGKGQRIGSFSIIDISKGGLGAKTDTLLREGDTLSLAFSLPETNDAITATVKVIWVDRGGMIGAKFADVPRRQLKQLQSWLEERDPSATRVTLIESNQRPETPRNSLRF